MNRSNLILHLIPKKEKETEKELRTEEGKKNSEDEKEEVAE